MGANLAEQEGGHSAADCSIDQANLTGRELPQIQTLLDANTAPTSLTASLNKETQLDANAASNLPKPLTSMIQPPSC